MNRKWSTILRSFLGVAAFSVSATIGCTGTAVAESDWPTGPVTIIPHSKPGGSPDVFARTLAQSLRDVIGQSIVIVNAPGGGGAMQMAKVRTAKPDGLTFGVSTLTHLSAMQGTLKGTFAPDDFSWIVAAQEEAMLLFARSDSDIKNLDDLATRARTSKIPLSVGGYGPVGSMSSIGVSMLENAAQVKFNWIAFNSTPDAIAAVLGGHMDVGASYLGAARPYFKAGRISGLGVLREERLATMPDLPTFNEQGYKVDTSWIQVRGLYGPAGIPLETQQKIADAVREAMAAESYRAYVENAGIADAWMGPVEYAQFVKQASGIAETQLRAAGKIK